MDVMRATDTASMQAVEEAAPTLDFLLLPIRACRNVRRRWNL